MTPPLNVAVLGGGFIGKQHIEAIRRIPNTGVRWIVDVDAATAKRLADELGIPRFSDDYREVLQDREVDIVHNCTPSNQHYCISKAVLEAGKHIYCEKPLTLTAAEAEELVALAQKTGRAHGVNFNYRHNAMVFEMRDRVRSGMVGTVLHVYGEYLQDWLMYKTDFNWRMDERIGVSRAVADIGSHCFDVAQFVLDRRITSVCAKLITAHPVRLRPEQGGATFSDAQGQGGVEVAIRTEDIAHIMVRFEGGTPGLFYLSQVSAGKKNGLALSLSGDKAALEWQQEQADRLWIGHRDRPNELLYTDPGLLSPGAKGYATLPAGHALAWHDALRNAIGAFYAAVRAESWNEPGRSYADFSDGARIMRLVEACLSSSATGDWVDVE